jgi:hypothetical protein
MTRSASRIVEDYLSALRGELAGAGARDTDDLVAEIRSLLTEAAGDDPEAAATEVGRLGEPAELARGILAERGLDASTGMSTGVWWRLGLAAPLDLAIGLALPLAAALPLYFVASFGQPRAASVAIAAVLAAGTLAWPFFVWRPWRRGGRSLSPGMTFTGIAVVRAPGFWRLVRIGELSEMGLAPRRRVIVAVLVALVALALIAGAVLVGVDAGGSWQLQSVAQQVYIGLINGPNPNMSTATAFVSADAIPALQPLWERISKLGIRTVQVGTPQQIAPGVYRFEVKEFRAGGSGSSAPVGSSTFTVGQRQWLRADGVGGDWAVVDIQPGAALR